MSDSKKSSKTSQQGKAGLSRRSFVAASAAGAALPLISGRGVWAADSENVIRVGFVSPRTGNLGTFGVGDGYLTSQVRKALDKGLRVGDKSYKGREALDKLSAVIMTDDSAQIFNDGKDKQLKTR